MVTTERVKPIPTGNPDIDQMLEGGILPGSLVLLEGESDTGKSILAQHITHAALRSGVSVAHYCTKRTVKDLMSQMVSLDLDATDYFLCDRLRVYYLQPSEGTANSESLNSLLEHFESLPIDIRLIVVDALSSLTSEVEERQIVDFLAASKQLCDLGRTIILSMQSNDESVGLLERAGDICDTHLALRIEQQGGHQVRSVEVTKLNNAPSGEQKMIHFNVEPGYGLKVI